MVSSIVRQPAQHTPPSQPQHPSASRDLIAPLQKEYDDLTEKCERLKNEGKPRSDILRAEYARETAKKKLSDASEEVQAADKKVWEAMHGKGSKQPGVSTTEAGSAEKEEQ